MFSFRNYLLIFILQDILVRADIFSSVSKIKDTLKFVNETNISQMFQSFFDQYQFRSDNLKRLLDVTTEMYQLLHRDNFNHHHPVEIFKFMRLCFMLHGASRDFTHSDEITFKESVVREFMEKLPKLEDFQGSATGLMRLYSVYQLSVEDFSKGVLKGYYSEPLSVSEMLDMVSVTYDRSLELKTNMLNTSVTILDYLNTTSGPNMTEQEARYFLALKTEIYKKANCTCTLGFQSIRREIVKTNPDLAKRFLPESKCGVIYKSCRSFSFQSLASSVENNFNKICRGEEVSISEVSKKYATNSHQRTCSYVHNNNPRLLLQPIKVEMLNKNNPYIAIANDVITEKEISFIQSFARERLMRGTVTTKLGPRPSTNKISQTTIIPFSESRKHLKSFLTRLYALSNLHERSFERLQVANYGVGGVYNIHVDLLFPGVKENFTLATNNRLLTVVTYLNDVTDGGETVFPEFGIRSQPKKGNVLMFFNLFRNGTGNTLTKHGSCPIIYGEKWIANQWVTRNGQEFTYPCTKEFE